MALEHDNFTLYLRGGRESELREVLRPFGDGGNLDRFTLEAWNAEVIIGAEVALIRVPQSTERGSLTTLIHELHEAARSAGLVLSDDINSRKTASELIRAFGLEGERSAQAHRVGPVAKWSTTQKILFWSVALAMLTGAWLALGALRDMAHALLEGR